MTTLFIATSFEDDLENAEYSVAIDSLVANLLRCNLGSIYDEESPVDKYELMKCVDVSLNALADINPRYKWVELMHFDVLHRYIYYKQLKERFLTLVKTRTESVNNIVLSSLEDETLVIVIRELCDELGIRMKLKSGEIYPGKFLHIFRKKYDIPTKDEIDKYIDFSSVISIFKKINLKEVDAVYMHYPNLREVPTNWVKLNLRYFGVINALVNKIKRKLNFFSDEKRFKISLSSSNDKFDKSTKDQLLSVCDPALIEILEQEYVLFCHFYPNNYLNLLAKKLSRYLTKLNPKRVVTYSSFSAAGLFITKVARKIGFEVQYLPHGINNKYQIYHGNVEFSPNSILAWNSVAKNKYEKWGFKSTIFNHPSIPRQKLQLDRKLPSSLKSLKSVLVVLSPGSPDYPDQCFRDVITLGNFFSTNYHVMPDFKSKRIYFENARPVDFDEYIKNFKEVLGFEPNFLDCDLNLSSIAKSYDLVVVCMYSTGLFYCALSGSPLIIFAREKMDLDLVDLTKFQVAYNLPSLREMIETIKKRKFT
jgi:hypothetical protein